MHMIKVVRLVILCRIVEISRSIGDAYLKKAEFNKAPLLAKFRLSEPFDQPILKAEPAILVQKLCPQELFLILASDGLWEQMSNQEAVNINWNETFYKILLNTCCEEKRNQHIEDFLMSKVIPEGLHGNTWFDLQCPKTNHY
ncbi:hypothetical protein JHK82_051039 [Glycine max]|nr:hypothetical protein JHK85_051740 [Glycine max]KAG5092261.1 hypothetical protein JHK82_051039 [Glycine max]KAG5095340.1 hypothetical protein JHK84_050928 [Glycine max]